jgi:hypothetical protein
MAMMLRHADAIEPLRGAAIVGVPDIVAEGTVRRGSAQLLGPALGNGGIEGNGIGRGAALLRVGLA